MAKVLSSIFDRVFVIFFVFVFAQIPAFMQQYTDQLIGHVNELKLLVAHMKQNATHSGKTLDQLLQKFLNSQDTDFAMQGRLMQTMSDRYEKLASALNSLLDASPATKLFKFFWHYDSQIGSSAWNHFSLTLPITLDGLIYAFIGMLVGILLFQGLKKLFGGKKQVSQQRE